MSLMEQISGVAVLTASLVAVILGALWYSPPLFGILWRRLLRLEREIESEDLAGPGRGYAVSALSTIVSAIVLALLIHAGDFRSAREGMVLACFCWLGFTGASGIQQVGFGARGISLFLIDSGYSFLSFVIMGAILGAWA